MTTQATHTPGPWYATKAGNIADQGIIASEVTPDTVAVSYKYADAALLAAAPTLLSALKAARECLEELSGLVASGAFDAAEDWVTANARELSCMLTAAIYEGEGGQQ